MSLNDYLAEAEATKERLAEFQRAVEAAVLAPGALSGLQTCIQLARILADGNTEIQVQYSEAWAEAPVASERRHNLKKLQRIFEKRAFDYYQFLRKLEQPELEEDS